MSAVRVPGCPAGPVRGPGGTLPAAGAAGRGPLEGGDGAAPIRAGHGRRPAGVREAGGRALPLRRQGVSRERPAPLRRTGLPSTLSPRVPGGTTPAVRVVLLRPTARSGDERGSEDCRPLRRRKVAVGSPRRLFEGECLDGWRGRVYPPGQALRGPVPGGDGRPQPHPPFPLGRGGGGGRAGAKDRPLRGSPRGRGGVPRLPTGVRGRGRRGNAAGLRCRRRGPVPGD